MKGYSLAWKYIKSAPKRAALTILGIAMALAMMMCIGNAISSVYDSSQKELRRKFGDWDVMVNLENHVGQDKDITNYDHVNHSAVIYENATFLLQEQKGSQSETEWFETSAGNFYISTEEALMEMMKAPIAEGRFPTNGKEVLVSPELAKELGVGVGDTINAQVGQLKYPQSEYDEEPVEGESDVAFEGRSETLTVTGILVAKDDYQGVFRDAEHVLLAGPQQKPASMVLFTLDNGTNIQTYAEKMGQELGIDGDYMAVNQTVQYSSIVGMLTTMFMVGVLFLFACGMIALAAISIVRNSFSMNVTERMRDYGLLRCAGATKKQIRRLIRQEVMIQLLIAFPLALVISFVASTGVLAIVNNMKLAGIPHIYLSVSWFFVLLSLLISLLAMVIAVVGPSRKAAQTSPILITTGQDQAPSVLKSSASRDSKLSRRLGLEWRLASRNRRASGRRSRTTIFSMSVSIALLLATAGMMQTYLVPELETVQSEIDIFASALRYEDTAEDITDEEFYEYCDKASKISGVTGAASATVTLTDSLVGSTQLTDSQYIHNAYGTNTYGQTYMPVQIMTIGRAEYEELQRANADALGNMSYDEWVASKQNILLNYGTIEQRNEYGRETGSKYMQLFNIQSGQTLKLGFERFEDVEQLTSEEGDYIQTEMTDEGRKRHYAEWDFPIGPIIENRVWYETISSYRNRAAIYMPKENAAEFNSFIQQAVFTPQRVLYLQTDPAYNADVEMALYELGSMHVSNLFEEERTYRNLIYLISICVYSFVGVIAFISCLNIINIISTNMVLRKRDFGLLQAVGMSAKQMRKMIIYECGQFSMRAVLFGGALGALVLFGLRMVIGLQSSTPFVLSPYLVVGIFVASFLVAVIAAWPTWQKMKKISIMDSIRHVG